MQNISQNKSMVAFLILLITLIWGYAWVLMKEAVNYMGPFTFSTFRFATGTLTMIIVLLLLKVKRPPLWSWKHLIVIGFLQTTVVFTLVMYGLQFVEAGKSSVLLYSMPVWSTVLSVWILKEKVTKGKIIGLSFGLLGLFTILGWDIWRNQTPEVLIGETLIIIAAISWGASNVYYRKTVSKLSQLQVNTYQMLFGTVGLAIVAVVLEGGDSISFTPYSFYIILFTGVLASAFCFTAWFFVLNAIEMTTATIATLLVPVFGLFLGWLLIDEDIGVSIVIGTGLIISGIVISTLAKRKK
ncbi:DMT family transporter [Gracilibacillus kekensis]|uniref:Permease of the drug/metabolite transporter (DMT) superfamily n=1 Tax=Gracilibacillus kekensis TaxID=1027249 RepID=A0A1M7QX38_9BACI|nr:DMT family transporter [Gracilibacillus kekensis]SHN36625.1 Permease of the drug/metabolite transporter (DMT) superfamily [Gracilibacillus kekensis]